MTLHASKRLEKLLLVTLWSCSFQQFSIYKPPKFFFQKRYVSLYREFKPTDNRLASLSCFSWTSWSILQTPRGTQTTGWKTLLQRKKSTGLITLAHSPEALRLLPSCACCAGLGSEKMEYETQSRCSPAKWGKSFPFPMRHKYWHRRSLKPSVCCSGDVGSKKTDVSETRSSIP